MDTQTGEIVPGMLAEELRKRFGKTFGQRLKPINIPLTEKQVHEMKIGRNDPCPCGSGKKFKRCCLHSQKEGG